MKKIILVSLLAASVAATAFAEADRSCSAKSGLTPKVKSVEVTYVKSGVETEVNCKPVSAPAGKKSPSAQKHKWMCDGSIEGRVTEIELNFANGASIEIESPEPEKS